MKSLLFSRKAQSWLLTCLILLTCVPAPVRADEGMYLPDSIPALPFDQLKRRGLQLSPEEIYSQNAPSLADAVGRVGIGANAGGSGAFVSSEGLMLTNHHIAFEALTASSSIANDYVSTGYVARTRAEELPAKDYTISITQGVKDITSEVNKGIPETLPLSERNEMIARRVGELQRAVSQEDAKRGLKSRILPLNEGTRYYLFTSLVLRDVRIVYAPPKSIGYYGGDEENFRYPRFCGDFAFLRAYVGPDGKPADYNKSNIPYTPAKFLTLNAGGVREGDFTMVLGYPNMTRRYRESYSIAYNQSTLLPIQIDFLKQRIRSLQSASERNTASRIKLQDSILSLNNTLKSLEGGLYAITRADLTSQKQAQEQAFKRYVAADSRRQAQYGEVLPKLDETYSVLSRTGRHDQLISMLLSAGSTLDLLTFAARVSAEREKPEAERNPQLLSSAQAVQQRLAAHAERDPQIERETYTYLFEQAAKLPPTQPLAALEKLFGKLQGGERRKAEADFIEVLVADSELNSADYLSSLFKMSLAQLRALNKPSVNFALDLNAEAQVTRDNTKTYNATLLQCRSLLVRGMSMMRGAAMYPDANNTLRFTFGEVKSLRPQRGRNYPAFTKLSGLIEKDTGREPFNVPDKLKQLYRVRAFGDYARTTGSDMPVNFIATTDIIGGNSGSPIMNGRGEQVGIVFDNNYEALGNDFFYDGNLQRTIAVDIRYVLFIVGEFAGASHILDELTIRGATTKKAIAGTR
jgi:hypothetical protein